MPRKNTQKPPEVTQETPSGSNEELMGILKSLASGVEQVNKNVEQLGKRVTSLEDGGKNAFKAQATSADIEKARETRENIDPKINAIVDEMLGEDFGVQILPRGDQPGFRFTLIVPPRLSDNVAGTRPVRDPKNTDQYKKDTLGNVEMEEHMPQDRRSRNISSHDSYDAIKLHCERVRANIVATFAKMQKPLPAFKVK